MHTETIQTVSSAPARVAGMARAILRALAPRWMLQDGVAVPRHHRMGGWERLASFAAREAMAAARRQESVCNATVENASCSDVRKRLD